MPSPTPKIIDSTLREGGFRLGHLVSIQQVTDLSRELARAGIRHMEVGHGLGIGGLRRGHRGLHNDLELLKAAHRGSKELNFVVYLEPKNSPVTELELIQDHFQIGRVAVNPNELGTAMHHVQRLKSLKKTALVELQRIHRFTPEKIAEFGRTLEGEGADAILLSDTYGGMDFTEVEAYFQALRPSVKIAMGFQGRNNTHRAVHNAWTALQNGAEWFDASFWGLGRGAGITNLEIMVSLFQREGHCKEINPQELNNIASWLIAPHFKEAPPAGLLDFLVAGYKIDTDRPTIVVPLCEILGCTPNEFFARALELLPESLTISDAEFAALLKEERLDFNVVMTFLETGRIMHLTDKANSSS